MLDRVIRSVNRALLGVAGLGVLVLALVVLSGVISRYVLGSPFTFVNPATEYLLLAVVFLAMAGALQYGAHVRVSFVTELLPRRTGLLIRQIGDFVGIIVAAVMFWLSVTQFMKVVASGETDISILRIPLWAIQWLPVVGFGLLTVTFLLMWIRAWGEMRIISPTSVDPMVDGKVAP